MPFCPKCRDEFEDWVKTCPDCRIKLVAELRVVTEPTVSPGHSWRHPRPPKAKDEPVLLATASNEPEARMWAGILENNGIRAMVKTYDGGGFRYPPVSSIIQPSNLQFDVYVLKSDVGRARAILDRASNPDSRLDRPQRPGRSVRSDEPLVVVATPSNALEALTWAETLENSGIHCLDKSASQYSEGASYPYQQILVLQSDARKAGEILARISNRASLGGVAHSREPKKRRLSTTAAGIVDVANGVAYLGLAVALAIVATTHPLIPLGLTVIGVLAIVGGICTLLRKRWWIALAGALVAMVPFFPIALIAGSRDEFK